MVYEYTDVIARMYDQDYAELRTPSGDVAFYVEEAERGGGPVAEFGCGTGRILIPTLEAGLEAVGVDVSPEMLERVRAKRPDAEVFVGDMRDHDLGRTFALVTIPFRALSHIEEIDEHVRVFRNLRHHLAPEGRLVFDVFHPRPDLLVEPHEERFEREVDGRKIRRLGRSTPERSRQRIDVVFRWEIEDAAGTIVEEHTARFSMRWFHRYELEHALARAGLEIEALYGDFDRSAFRDDSPEMIFVAKPAPAGGV
ncbi:MAG: class I SAM-dependent methyltransferase [Planctomycetota bacterium]|jgi:SAM-dependent methyltransferase